MLAEQSPCTGTAELHACEFEIVKRCFLRSLLRYSWGPACHADTAGTHLKSACGVHGGLLPRGGPAARARTLGTRVVVGSSPFAAQSRVGMQIRSEFHLNSLNSLRIRSQREFAANSA